jgi:Ca2+-binding EF-hand superfamily protein
MMDIDNDGSGTLSFDEFLLLYKKIQNTKNNDSFLQKAKKKMHQASTSGDNGFGVDMNKLKKEATERKLRKEKQRILNKKRVEQNLQLLKHFSKRELNQLKLLFNTLDVDKSGTIDYDEIKNGLLSTNNFSLTEDELDQAMGEFSKNSGSSGDGGDGGDGGGGGNIIAKLADNGDANNNNNSNSSSSNVEEMSLDWIAFVSMCKILQDGKKKGSGNEKLIINMAEQKLLLNAERKKLKEVELLSKSMKLKEEKERENQRRKEKNEKIIQKKNEIREKKAVSRKERAEAARKRREQAKQ